MSARFDSRAMPNGPESQQRPGDVIAHLVRAGKWLLSALSLSESAEVAIGWAAVGVCSWPMALALRLPSFAGIVVGSGITILGLLYSFVFGPRRADAARRRRIKALIKRTRDSRLPP